MDLNEIAEDELAKLHIAIAKGEYSFPEFSSYTKKDKRKELSLKAHSVTLRLFRRWQSIAQGTADAATE